MHIRPYYLARWAIGSQLDHLQLALTPLRQSTRPTHITTLARTSSREARIFQSRHKVPQMAPKKIPIESRPIYERADWTRDRDKLDRRVRRWRLKEWYDGKAEHFALSKPRIEPPGTREDDFWEVCSLFLIAHIIKQLDNESRWRLAFLTLLASRY